MTITRERHPFEGRTLAVNKQYQQRRGVTHLLVILPDGSRSLVPAAWTDWGNTEAGSANFPISHNLGTLNHLLKPAPSSTLSCAGSPSRRPEGELPCNAAGISQAAAAAYDPPYPLGTGSTRRCASLHSKSSPASSPHARGKAAAGDKQ